MKKIVKVTRGDIKRGHVCSAHSCPVALAIMRLVKKGIPVEVVGVSSSRSSAIFVGNRKIPCPEPVREFAEKFDYGEPVDPFSFEIGIDKRLLREGK